MNFIQRLIQGFLDRLAAMVQGRAYIPQDQIADQTAASPQATAQAAPQPVSQPQSELYTFQTQMDNIPAIISVDLAYQQQFPLPDYADLLELIVQVGGNNEQVAAADSLLTQFRQNLSSALYLGSLTSNGIKSFYLYLPAGTVVPDTLRSLPVQVKYSYEVKPDANWSYYAELLPQPAEQPAQTTTPQPASQPAVAPTPAPAAPAPQTPVAGQIAQQPAPVAASTQQPAPAMPAYNPEPVSTQQTNPAPAPNANPVAPQPTPVSAPQPTVPQQPSQPVPPPVTNSTNPPSNQPAAPPPNQMPEQAAATPAAPTT